MKAKDPDLHGLCNRILESERFIRFVGIPIKWANRLYHPIESARTETNLSDSYRKSIIEAICRFSKYHDNKSSSR